MSRREIAAGLALCAMVGGTASAQTRQRLMVTPSTRTVVVGDTLRFSAKLLDESGNPVPDAIRVLKGE